MTPVATRNHWPIPILAKIWYHVLRGLSSNLVMLMRMNSPPTPMRSSQPTTSRRSFGEPVIMVSKRWIADIAPSCRLDPKRAFELLRSQGRQRIDARGAPGWEPARNRRDADQRGNDEQHRRHVLEREAERVGFHDSNGRDGHRQTDRQPDRRHGDAAHEEMPHDSRGCRTHRQPYADLTRALRDRERDDRIETE